MHTYLPLPLSLLTFLYPYKILHNLMAQEQSSPTPLFGEDGKSHSPFPVASATHSKENMKLQEPPFSSSFFNLFNYSYGMLNAHKDRYLVTVIYTQTAAYTEQQAAPRTSLWVRKGVDVPEQPDQWVNADRTVSDREVLVLIGEEMQQILAGRLGVGKGEGNEPLPLPLPLAAEHSVRVDPLGKWKMHSGFVPGSNPLYFIPKEHC